MGDTCGSGITTQLWRCEFYVACDKSAIYRLHMLNQVTTENRKKKLDAVGPNFPICMTWEILLPLRPGKKRTKKLIDRDILPIAGGESNKQMLNPVKLTFLDTL